MLQFYPLIAEITWVYEPEDYIQNCLDNEEQPTLDGFYEYVIEQLQKEMSKISSKDFKIKRNWDMSPVDYEDDVDDFIEIEEEEKEEGSSTLKKE